MALPVSRRTCLLTILFLCVVFIAFIFHSMHQLPPPRKYVIKANKQVDTASLSLNRTMAKRLKQDHQLDYIKSRGATIFVDKNDVIRVPPNNILDVMELRDLEELYDRYLGSIQIICKRKVHLGDVTDGGYDVCEDVKVAPIRPCLTYSFSFGEDSTFEEALANMYKCEVHLFVSGTGDVKQQSTLKIHDIKAAYVDNTKPKTLVELKKELHHKQKSVSMIKLNVHGGEWLSLAQLLTGAALRETTQLLVRFNTLVDQSLGSVDHRNKLDYRTHLSVLRSLYNRGFRIFYHRRVTGRACVFTDDFNITRTGCHEVSMMKTKNSRTKIDTDTRGRIPKVS